jgi:hypothetical protein
MSSAAYLHSLLVCKGPKNEMTSLCPHKPNINNEILKMPQRDTEFSYVLRNLTNEIFQQVIKRKGMSLCSYESDKNNDILQEIKKIF